MSGPNFNAQMNEVSNSFSAHLVEVTTVFNVEFGDFITLYRGVVRVWIGNGTNGEDGVLYAEMVDGVVQNLGPVTGYYYARQAGFQGTFVEWVQLLLDTTVNAQNAAQSASEALASEQAAASSEAAAAASEVSAEKWATGGTGATYSSGKSAKEQADRAAMWAAGTSSGNGSATNNAKYWSDLAQSAKNTAVSAKDTAVASEAVAVAKASDSEAWAVGQRGGSDVPSTDQTYQNNSKYYAEIAVAGRRWIAYNWDDDPTRAFEVGEFVTKDDTIYMFIAPHAANTPWSLNEVEVTNLGALLKDLQDNVVLVQQEEPTSENNKIWLKPSNVEVLVPTLEEFNGLADAKINKPAVEGTAGQVLSTNGNGTTQWIDAEPPTDQQVEDAVSDWLDSHPEATTTVEDGSITEEKLAADVKSALQSKVDEPASEGTSGQVLTTDGNGGRLWTTVRSGGSANVTYVTPEDYGAVGDGVTDDTTAIQAALDYGRTNNVAVRGYKKYKTTSSLTISGSYQDVFIRIITYTGNSCGLYIKGSYNNVRVGQLYCSNGGGIVMNADTANIHRNRVSAVRIFAKNDAVKLQADGSYMVVYNSFDIRDIKSDTANCYLCTTYNASENVFMNSSCTCENGWAIYNAAGRYYNFTLEGNVKNGIVIGNTNAQSSFFGFRYRELVDKVVYRENGTNPNAVGGTLIKFVGLNERSSLFVGNDAIPYDAIDVSEMASPESELQSQTTGDRLIGLAFFHIIDAPIRYGNYNTTNGLNILGIKMIVHGGRRICIPVQQVEQTISTSTYDMRDAQVALNEAKTYPTKMIIGVDNCIIYLPPSYNPEGYNEFIVDQSSHTCTIYDYNDTTTPVFNGATHGSGVYRLKAITDLSGNAYVKKYPSRTASYFDSSNYHWEVERIDQTSRGGSNCGVINVADYGAVGDGTTDDSAAVQLACNAGYDIYFESNKTYYLGSTGTINHDIKLHGGKNTVIKTKSVNGITYNGIMVSGTQKLSTTLTSDYLSKGTDTDANAENRLTLTSMTGINIGDLIEIVATDQYYSYARQYYYLGGVFKVVDIYDGHIYIDESIPFDITNTGNVTVNVYDAPSVEIRDLKFEGDLDPWTSGVYQTYRLLGLEHCKDSRIIDCDFSEFVIGLGLVKCFNTFVDGSTVSKSKYNNTLTGDGYGITVNSCTNTTIQRIVSLCAQNSIDLTGTIPCINTYISKCNLASEARASSIGLHENSYNLVVEDCILAGMSLYGTATVNRCRFVRNLRLATASSNGIIMRGSHRAEYARFAITNCEFGDSDITVRSLDYQSGIQSIDSIIDSITIENCTGGSFFIDPSVDLNILSNTINSIILTRWKNCKKIFRRLNNETIKLFKISQCSFTHILFMTDNIDADGIVVNNIGYLDVSGCSPMTHKISISKNTYGETLVLPQDVNIELSSDNSSAQYVVCGRNLVSDNADDYVVGSVGGSVGSALTRSKSTGSSVATVSIDTNGNPVYTQKANTSSYSFYPVGMVYVAEYSTVTMSATLKNTGETSGATFRPYIAVVDCETGLVTYRNNGTIQTATSEGVEITHTRDVLKNSVVMCYYYCSSPVNGSETTFEDYTVTITPAFAPAVNANEPYTAKRITGNGTIKSLEGVNHIMSSESVFNVKLAADYVGNLIGLLPSGSEVIF